jgi:hypothetical protein
VTSYARGDLGGVFSSVTGLIKTAGGNGQKANKIAKATKTSPSDCVSKLWNFLLHLILLPYRFPGVVVRIHRPAQTRKKPGELQAR